MTRAWEIKADIRALQTTGQWVDGKVPEWAAKRAEELHCRCTNPAVIEWGLWEVIRQLEDELLYSESEAEMWRRESRC